MRQSAGGGMRLLALMWILALCAFMPFHSAAAEIHDEVTEGLDIQFAINPDEMVAPGDATMTFTIVNHTDQPIKNVYLTSVDGLLSEPIGQVAAGETQTLVRPHAVTQDELDAGCVRYVLSHDSPLPGGEKVTHALSAPLTKGSPRPNVDFTRQISSMYVSSGGQLTITYRVTNHGNVPVTAIYVRDTLGDFTGRLEQLDVGMTRTFISRVTLNAEAESAASLEYSVPTGETYARRLDPVTIRLSDSALDAQFSVGRSVFDPNRADAVLVLTNQGNDDYSEIAVMDDVYGGVIADSISLPRGGAPVEIAYTYYVRGDGEYRWRVTGTSLAGESLDFVTDTVALEDAEAAGSIDIALKVTPRTPQIRRAGRVTFDVEIANLGDLTAKDLQFYETERGEARRIAALPSGDPIRFAVGYDVRQDETFTFCLSYRDAAGHIRTATVDPIDVTITPSGAAPEPMDGEDRTLRGGSFKISSGSTFTVLLAVASAALVSMFTILLVTSLRARQERRRRIAAQKRRIKEELGKTNRFTPIKARGKGGRAREKKKSPSEKAE